MVHIASIIDKNAG